MRLNEFLALNKTNHTDKRELYRTTATNQAYNGKNRWKYDIDPFQMQTLDYGIEFNIFHFEYYQTLLDEMEVETFI